MRTHESTSSRRCYARCPRLYQYTRVLGYEAVREAPAPHFGTLMHKALEMYGIARWWGQQLGALKNALATLECEPDPWVRARAEALMMGYYARWGADELTYVSIEREFAMRVDGGCLFYGYHCRVDALVRDGSQLYIKETKTTGFDISLTSHYWSQLQLDPQISDYWLGAEAMGIKPAGVLYDVMRRPELKPGRAETPTQYRDRIVTTIANDPNKFYQRRIIVRLDHERQEAMRNLTGSLLQIRRSYEDDNWPANYDSCGKFGETCEFLPVCAGMTRLDSQKYRRRGNA